MTIYLIIINIIAGTTFAFDKFYAKHNRHRIPEHILHLLEILGGFPSIILLMYTLRHKCAKPSYYICTHIISLLWIIAIIILLYHRH